MRKSTALARHRLLHTIFCAALLIAASTGAQAQSPAPAFSKSFAPGTIGPGATSKLSFEISNVESGGPVTDLAFTDTLPAGVVIATPAAASTTCGGVLSAPDGGTTITFSGGSVGAGAACSIVVSVSSSSVGTHMNVSSDLTSSAGNSGTATDDLTVASDRPGFSKQFSPSVVSLGGRTTLTFVIDNTANQNLATNLAFSDTLPVGLTVAGPANESTTCSGATITAVPGTQVISMVGGLVEAASTCQVTVDGVAVAVGTLVNTSGELTSNFLGPLRSSGAANAALDVTTTQIALLKSFADDPVPPGGTVDLEFTIVNFDRTDAATSISFSDDLGATLAGLAAVGTPVIDPCGAGSSLSGTSLVTLTGGNLAAGAQCTFGVTLQVPAAAVTGAYPNMTSSLNASVGGVEISGLPGMDILFVAPAPLLTKTFTDDPVGAGDTVTLEFNIINTSPSSDATDIAFIDELTTFLGFPVSVTLPMAPCGAGSSFSLINLGFESEGLSLTGGNLAPGASCTFSVTIDVPVGQPTGAYTNLTTPITGTVDGSTAVGKPATDDLVVVAPPRLFKEFIDDPAQPGETTPLQFTLSHDALAPGDATGIAFTDDLDAVLTGLTAIGLPQNDVCGAGSQISGSATLTFTGGTLAPGEECTFSVTLQVPAAAPAGSHTNTTSEITATVSGVGATGNGATDDLMISGLMLIKEYIDDPALPGGTATLRFTLDNQNPTDDASGIAFTDDLGSTAAGLPGLAAVAPLPDTSSCGAGSNITGTTFLTFVGGSVAAETSCTFDITVQVPVGAADGTYNNVTSPVSATLGGSSFSGDPAQDVLIVDANRLTLAKEFTDDPVFPGDAVTLRFTIFNLDASQVADTITFTDDLGATLSGLTATGLPMNDVCGAGSQISGTGLLTLTGGNLGAGASCMFDISVQVPANAPGGVHPNTTSQVGAMIAGLAVTGGPAMDDLLINVFSFTKAFGGATPAGGTATLEFTIENPDASAGAVGLSFVDDLDAVVPGMVAVGLPVSGVCGPGSTLSGTSVLNLSGGELGPGESCVFVVDVQIPLATTPGSYDNTTGVLFASGIPSSAPATATIVIQAAAAAAAIPATTPAGTAVLIALLALAAMWLLKWRV